jgi:hypothetical protein
MAIPKETAISGSVPSVKTGTSDAGNSGAALTIDFRVAVMQKVTLTDACTFTFSNPQSGTTYGLSLVQNAVGSKTATWPANVNWEGGAAPTLTTTPTAKDFIIFVYDSVDDVFYGSALYNLS